MPRETGTGGRGARAAVPVMLAVLLLSPACGDDDDGGPSSAAGWRAPAEMEGTWAMAMEMHEHTTGELVRSDSYTGILCAGEAAPVDLGQGITCNTTATADGFRMTCSQTVPLEIPDCNGRTVIDLTFVCTADAMTGTGTATGSYVGAGCGALSDVAMVFDITVDGGRTGPAPDGACTGKSPCGTLTDLLRVPALPWWR